MNTERAKQLLTNINYMQGALGVGFENKLPFPEMTAAEKQEIFYVWERMSGSSSFYDAVCRIARGEAYETNN